MAGPRSSAMMADLGLTEADFPDEVIVLWPEVADAMELYSYMTTQWRPEGTGLDYSALAAVWEMIDWHKDGKWRKRALEGMRVFEHEAIERFMAQRRKGK